MAETPISPALSQTNCVQLNASGQKLSLVFGPVFGTVQLLKIHAPLEVALLPSLPGNDINPTAREQALAKDRKRYEFDYSIGQLPMATGVPKGEGFTARYMAKAVETEALLKANRVATRTDHRLDEERREVRRRLFSNGIWGAIKGRLEDVKDHGLAAAPMAFADDVNDYEALIKVIPDPASQVTWNEDAYFAWQRFGGCNPTHIKRFNGELPLADLSYATGGDSLAAADASGRLFVLDYADLAGTPTDPSFGFPRYVCGATGLFVRTLAGPIMPVGVRPSPTSGIIQPGQPGWDSAKNALNTADSAVQGITEHLGKCHVFANAVLLCTARNLAPAHPLRILLWPHFEMTLAANETMKTAVIGKDGYVDQLQGPSLDTAIEMARQGACETSLIDTMLPRDLSLRGVDDRQALPDYPYRDDGVLIWSALENWVRRYLGLYYRTQADITQDVELYAWHQALTTHVTDIPSTSTFEGLVDLATAILFRITAHHTVINYGSYDHLAYPPNSTTARYGPPDEADFLKVLPPLGLAQHVLDLMLALRNIRENTLGHLSDSYFKDTRVHPLLARFQGELVSAETRIKAREQTAQFSFPFLMPSRIAASIHV